MCRNYNFSLEFSFWGDLILLTKTCGVCVCVSSTQRKQNKQQKKKKKKALASSVDRLNPLVVQDRLRIHLITGLKKAHHRNCTSSGGTSLGTWPKFDGDPLQQMRVFLNMD